MDSSSLDALGRSERLLLIRFVCSFVWADFQVKPAERALVADLVQRLRLDEDERSQVQEWLRTPPAPESVDPTAVPRRHRELFLRAMASAIEVDGEIAPEERDSFAVFSQLLD